MSEERAILAEGCLWGMQDLIRKFTGVISTRAGYAGGNTPNATYRNHGTHAEAIEIIFDPDKLSYRRLLEFFESLCFHQSDQGDSGRHPDWLSRCERTVRAEGWLLQILITKSTYSQLRPAFE